MKNDLAPTSILVESCYLPPFTSFVMMQSFSLILVDAEEPFRKSTLRNRCSIAGANGVILLTVPVVEGRNVRKAMRDVRIDYRQPWQRIHWGSIFSAYGRSTYFIFYKEKFAPFYHEKFEFLLDFNIALLEICFEILKMNGTVVKTNLNGERQSSEVFDGRNKLLTIENLPSYRQVFEQRNGFIPNLSIIDLIFNAGPDARELVRSVQ